MRVLLTGATGFLGRAVTRRLLEAGHLVTALVRSTDGGLTELGVEQRIGDIVSLDVVINATTDCDAVIHCAARTTPLARIDDYYDTNVRGTQNIIAACEVNGVRRLVATSCAGIVIDREDLQGVDESQRVPARARTVYLATKATAERNILAANGAEITTVALRPPLLWGPGEAHWLPRIIGLAKKGNLRLFGEPARRIDTCYVDNAADAHIAALDRLEPGSPIAGKAYFITQGEPASIEGFINSLLRAAGYPAETRRVSHMLASALASTASIRRVVTRTDPLLTSDALAFVRNEHWFNIAAARRDLDYAPRVGMAEGFARVSAHLARERMRER